MAYALGFVNALDMKLEDRAVGVVGTEVGDWKAVTGSPSPLLQFWAKHSKVKP